jgi:DNA primase
VISNAKVAYVAVAPEGKEVEELVGKEILMSLRKKVPAEVYLRDIRRNSRTEGFKAEEKAEAPVEEFKGDVKKALKEAFKTIKDEKSALLLDASLDVINKVSSREVTRSIYYSKKKVYAVVINGSAIPAIVRACEEKGVKYVAATTFGDVGETSVNLISL